MYGGDILQESCASNYPTTYHRVTSYGYNILMSITQIRGNYIKLTTVTINDSNGTGNQLPVEEMKDGNDTQDDGICYTQYEYKYHMYDSYMHSLNRDQEDFLVWLWLHIT